MTPSWQLGRNFASHFFTADMFGLRRITGKVSVVFLGGRILDGGNVEVSTCRGYDLGHRR